MAYGYVYLCRRKANHYVPEYKTSKLKKKTGRGCFVFNQSAVQNIGLSRRKPSPKIIKKFPVLNLTEQKISTVCKMSNTITNYIFLYKAG